jgi:predicted ATPase
MLLFGLFISELSRNGPTAARPLGEQILAVAERAGTGALKVTAHLALGLVEFHLGNRAAAREHFVAGIEHDDEAVPSSYGVDLGTLLRLYLADASWHLGFADQARAQMRAALARATRSSRAVDRAWAAQLSAVLCVFLREPNQVAVHVRHTLDACTEEPNHMHALTARIMEGWSLAELGDVDRGRAQVCAGLEELRATEQRLGLEYYHCLLADTYALSGDFDAALRALAEGEAACPDQLTERARTLGHRAELLARTTLATAEVDAAFAAALTCARRTSKSYLLRTATSYARWLSEHGRAAEARDLLAPLHASFTEGFDTRDLREAQELLQALDAPADDVLVARPLDATHQDGRRGAWST